MHVSRKLGTIDHLHISDLPRVLNPPSTIVLNRSKVLPANFSLQRSSGGRVSVLLIEQRTAMMWRAMLKPAKRIQAGETLLAEDGTPVMTAVRRDPDHHRYMHVELLDEKHWSYGRIPLPPYLRRDADAVDLDRYQTVYADRLGSVAAPTAGLHFTESLMERLVADGHTMAKVTLHVGPGTFLPVTAEDPTHHEIHSEGIETDSSLAEAISNARLQSAPVVAVGTTSVRTLESTKGQVFNGKTDLFIFPGYTFSTVDQLITNFHLPKSSLLMLVSAFMGYDLMREAYRQAIENEYRFYSYGDAMYIS